MNEQWAARSRQLEGMSEIRLQKDVPASTSRQLQKSQNVFETPEGAVGRAMGQRGALLDDLGAAANPALGTVRELAQSPVAARQLRQNLGPDATNNITDAATAQLESARRLASATRDPKYDAGEIEAGDLGLLAAALNPTSMAVTKARGFMVLVEKLRRIPENRSRAIVDMLFSRDPALTDRAMRALRSEGQAGVSALRDIVSIMGGAVLGEEVLGGVAATGLIGGKNPDNPAAETDDAADMSEEGGEPDIGAMSNEELTEFIRQQREAAEPNIEEMSDEELKEFIRQQKEAAAVPYGREVIESLFPGVEVTSDNRAPNSALGRANPSSYHNTTDGAVDVRPIPGMTFDEFVAQVEAAGYNVVEKRDEVTNPSGHATGPHWHIVIG
jgi:hypothetical protein